jgi:hypothetical protein
MRKFFVVNPTNPINSNSNFDSVGEYARSAAPNSTPD